MAKANLFKTVLSAALLAAIPAGVAHAQTCTETEFTSKSGELYLRAETQLFQENNPSGALAALNQLRGMEINCYERGAALRLSAAAKIKMDNPAGAVQDMEEAIRVGAIPQKDIAGTYYNIAQLYLSADNVPKAREYMDRWLASGARPTKDQYFQLAVIYQKLNDFAGALPHAERVLQMEGSNASTQTIDFLIFLYDRTGNRAKKAALLERKLVMDPSNRQVWDAIAGEYFQAGDQRKAFEVQKAMYHAGLLTTEDELMRIVNFYNQFNAPYEAAKVLEKEINAGRISDNLEKLDLLANLYQVAREYDKAIPVVQRAAQKTSDGRMDERLGRSYFELGEYQKTIDALTTALSRGNLKEPGYANVLIGRSHYELGNRAQAREFFQAAQNFSDGRRGGQGWMQFMASEDAAKRAYEVFQRQVKLEGYVNEQKNCKQMSVLGDANVPESCSTVEERISTLQEELAELDS